MIRSVSERILIYAFELEFAESLGKEIDIDSIVSEEISNELLKIM